MLFKANLLIYKLEWNSQRAYLMQLWRHRMTSSRCRRWEMPRQWCRFSSFPSTVNCVIFSSSIGLKRGLVNLWRPDQLSTFYSFCQPVQSQNNPRAERTPLSLIIARRRETTTSKLDQRSPAWPEAMSLLFPVSHHQRRRPWIWWRISKLPGSLIASAPVAS